MPRRPVAGTITVAPQTATRSASPSNANQTMPLADQVTLFGHRLAAALTESGIIGMRCAGAHHFMDVAWKRAFDSGQHVGPGCSPAVISSPPRVDIS